MSTFLFLEQSNTNQLARNNVTAINLLGINNLTVTGQQGGSIS